MYMNDNMYVCLCIYIDRKCLISIWPLRSLRNNEETHCQYIYLFIYFFIYLFIYLFYVGIYNKKHKNSDLYISLYTISYTNGI